VACSVAGSADGMTKRRARFELVFRLAHDVWQDERAVHDFLMTPHPMLRGKTPIACAATEAGARRVVRILLQLQHGTLA
jgi:putative toxin-antitoxin system antitoxin component (TIGR02293 family)